MILKFSFAFIIALAIRIAWHKYTTGIVYAMNPYLLALVVCIQLFYSGFTYLPFIMGLFFIDICFYISKYYKKENSIKQMVISLSKWLPEKKDQENVN